MTAIPLLPPADCSAPTGPELPPAVSFRCTSYVTVWLQYVLRPTPGLGSAIRLAAARKQGTHVDKEKTNTSCSQGYCRGAMPPAQGYSMSTPARPGAGLPSGRRRRWRWQPAPSRGMLARCPGQQSRSRGPIVPGAAPAQCPDAVRRTPALPPARRLGQPSAALYRHCIHLLLLPTPLPTRPGGQHNLGPMASPVSNVLKPPLPAAALSSPSPARMASAVQVGLSPALR